MWLILRGTLPTAAKARLDEQLDHFSDLFALVSLWERHMTLGRRRRRRRLRRSRTERVSAGDLDELSARAAADDESAVTAQDALGLLFRFARSGS